MLRFLHLVIETAPLKKRKRPNNETPTLSNSSDHPVFGSVERSSRIMELVTVDGNHQRKLPMRKGAIKDKTNGRVPPMSPWRWNDNIAGK
jgi:hypothetical protein